MTRPALAAFLEDSMAQSGEGSDGSGAVAETADGLLSVLAEVVARRGAEAVVEQTGLDRELLDSLVEGTLAETSNPAAGLTLETAAEILAVDSTFPSTEIRHRIRDHLIVQMSRRPVDAETLAVQYGFGDAASLRAKIEGNRPLSLREYVRLRVALDR